MRPEIELASVQLGQLIGQELIEKCEEFIGKCPQDVSRTLMAIVISTYFASYFITKAHFVTKGIFQDSKLDGLLASFYKDLETAVRNNIHGINKINKD